MVLVSNSMKSGKETDSTIKQVNGRAPSKCDLIKPEFQCIPSIPPKAKQTKKQGHNADQRIILYSMRRDSKHHVEKWCNVQCGSLTVSRAVKI